MRLPQPDGPKGDVLIVDDALPNLQILSTVLTEYGYEARGASNGPTALMLIRAKPPDLILLDVRMPGMDGYQVCRQLKADEKTRDIPVIFISAMDELTDKVQGFAVGGVDYITKPIQVEEVLARVQTHLALYKLQTQLEAQNAQLEQEIVERKGAEAALQRARDELEQRVVERTAEVSRLAAVIEAAIEQTPAGIIIADAPDVRIRVANSAALEIRGETTCALTDIPLERHPQNWQTFHPDGTPYKPEDLPLSQAVLYGKTSKNMDVIIRRQSGEERWVWGNAAPIRNAQGEITAGVVVFPDITEQKRAEEQVHRRSLELALLNRVIAASTSTLDVEQVLQIACRELARAFDLPQAAAALLNAEKTGAAAVAEYLAPGRPSVLSETMFVTDSPMAEYILEHKAPLAVTDAQTDERLAPVQDLMRERGTLSLLIVPVMERGQVVGVIRLDATERREFSGEEITLAQNVAAATGQALETARLHQELQRHAARLTRALEQQQELDRLRSEFIRNVTHELRTPLALVRGHAELLETGVLGELGSEQQESIAVIARRARALSNMMNDFAAIIDTEMKLQRQPVNLAELMHELLADSQVQATVEQAALSLAVKIAPDVSPVSGDPIQLRRVVDSLLDNALKFTPAGGHVAVRLRQEEESLVLEVSDTGIGIPEDQFERIFDRFYQIDGSSTRRYSGTGLGLALVKEIVEAHGGQVTVQSTVGHGSTFTVTLPVRPVDLVRRT